VNNIKRILLAEDELLVAKVTKLAFERKGYIVKHVVFAEDVLKEVLDFDPQLIILDIQLKNNGSGLQAGQEVRARHIQTPIIFTTGNSMEQTQEQIKYVNNSQLYIKPIDVDQLIGHIERELR
jgi:DNA-binding response OmpR family regulator